MLDSSRLNEFISGIWDRDILPSLADYIRIPAKSPLFDPEWQENGHIERAALLLRQWVEGRLRTVPGATIETIVLPGRTPVLLVEVPGHSDDVTLIYGHLDKQPEMRGWRDGLSPWEPLLTDGKLFGRGGADDGYALYGAFAALQALADQHIPHARCVVIIEACEESGSYDLPFYMNHLADRIGDPSLVICLDSGCGNYDQLWTATSLRGLTGGTLRVEVLSEGIHSGAGSGVVPCSFRVIRQLLSRLEDQQTGVVVPPEFTIEIPEHRVVEARIAAKALGSAIYDHIPFVGGMSPVSSDPAELILNRTWRAQLAVIGADGLPALNAAGNVLRPSTAVKLSLRLPPTLSAELATRNLKTILESDPPYGARVQFEPGPFGDGWNAPKVAPWLSASLDRASIATFKRPAAAAGEGGSIPFIGMLGAMFPHAQFVITGVLGPESNAHGPNEFLHVATAKHVTSAVARILADHHRRPGP